MDPETFATTWARLLGWFTRRGYSMDQAEDLVGETILRVVQAGKTQESIRYYYVAARSTATDRFRCQTFTVELTDIYAVDDAYFDDGDDVLEHLNDLEQRVVRLRAAGLRYQDIGQELGLSRSRVAGLIQHIREVTPRAQQNASSAALYRCRPGPSPERRENADGHVHAAAS